MREQNMYQKAVDSTCCLAILFQEVLLEIARRPSASNRRNDCIKKTHTTSQWDSVVTKNLVVCEECSASNLHVMINIRGCSCASTAIQYTTQPFVARAIVFHL